ncbi:MAG: DUF1835 domain-containing protein [Flavobacteriia bacterium]|nr:DUF1835 domain-containing protein [Flavobacteriia bacterium]OIP45081.1 MAG: DUF1835 domain-containing protein [Flavobacteriaceae bacterium CG2_30_31_66]PIV95275.1 MAG: DUF1835 domain-containing protein [Flavobacteriaceae bacterium CG17_big_fil_post_rev_8_21_14_2_50_31_13]PIX11405.1 MAG: DUF1835 domain-containing protein [Flavobacteriaceae bacterium CG_4_8_14_3_um_filter_31_8]PIY13606.1 MAG: DUF1835 domain-containing protein [Flavobacteriaceae bacterium CG_4_10_14_3_um_filter_31_253]PIZ11833
MKTSILHITNGDSTTNYLKKLQFSGDFITWREMLCEGKTTTDVGSETFWKNRFDFLKTAYKVNKQTFIEYTLKEYRNLCKKKEQNEIVLWFGHDLFCQINVIAVVSWLKRFRQGYQITLVGAGNATKNQKIQPFSLLNQEQINSYFKNRITLSQDDIEYADYIWQLYCSDSPLRLETVYKFNPMTPFQHLTAAIEAHLKRFPSIENGLNFVENNILKTANSNHFETKNELITSLLNEDDIYGFGDMQYENHVRNLQKLFSSLNPVKLSKKGKEVLEKQLNFYGQIRNEETYLGGSKKYNFLYQTGSSKLLQITS